MKRKRTDHKINNLVAKHAGKFNRSAVFESKVKYDRKNKRREIDAYSILNLAK